MNRARNRRIPFSCCAALVVALATFPPASARGARDPKVAASIQSAPKAPTNVQSITGPGLWHIVDVATNPAQRPAILNGQRSLWCGAYSPCWVDTVGYPNFEYDILYIDTGTHSSSYTLTLKMNLSTEKFYDYVYLVVSTGGVADPIGGDSNLLADVIAGGPMGNAMRFASWTGTITSATPGALAPAGDVVGDPSGEPQTLTATISLASGNRALYFVFVSDCLFSHQDGLWPWGTGVLLDDLITSDNGTIYADAVPAGGTDALGGAVIVGTPGAPIVSSRARSSLNPNPPVISAPPNQTHNEGESVTLTATATDADAGEQVSMSADGYPAGLTLSTTTGTSASARLSGTIPCGTAVGSPYTITWCASSPLHETTATTVLTVAVDPHAPFLTAPANVTRAIGSTVSVFVTVADPDGDGIGSLTADLSVLPTGNDATFTADGLRRNGTLTWHPVTGNEGDYPVKFTASNALSGCVTTLIHIVSPTATGVSVDQEVPSAPTLDDCRPNPFNPGAMIPFTLPRETRAILQIFDIRGRLVTTLVNGVLSAGPHESAWDGRNAAGRQAATGVYLSRLEAAGVSLSRRLVLLR